jgi:hypothetical protein
MDYHDNEVVSCHPIVNLRVKMMITSMRRKAFDLAIIFF